MIDIASFDLTVGIFEIGEILVMNVVGIAIPLHVPLRLEYSGKQYGCPWMRSSRALLPTSHIP